MIMRTLGRHTVYDPHHNELVTYHVWQDMNASVFLNDRQYDSPYEAARAILDPKARWAVCEQVMAAYDGYVDGEAAFDEAREDADGYQKGSRGLIGEGTTKIDGGMA